MPRCPPWVLSRRAQFVTLAPWEGDETPPWKLVLAGEAREARWRVIELLSLSSAPFEAKLSWSAGEGSGASALVSVARSARVAVWATSVQIEAANLVNASHRVMATVADSDSFVQTRNQHEVRGESTGDRQDFTTDIPIPPFSSRLSVYIADGTADLDAWYLLVYDGQGTLRSATPLSAIPDGGLEVGSAGAIALYSGGAVAAWRAVFTLSL